jgi:hypothetical protein
VDWILNREKPSVKPPGGPTSPPAAMPSSRGLLHDGKRIKTERDLASPPPVLVRFPLFVVCVSCVVCVVTTKV